MNTFKKIIISLLAFNAALITATLLFYQIVTSNVSFNPEKLETSIATLQFYDCNNQEIPATLYSANHTVIDCDLLPDYVKNAFIAVEDRRFYSHHGTDIRALLRAGLNNLKSRSFKEGGSTISQQLIKNTHLSNEKTLKRKLKELKLVKILEKTYNKKQILNFYLNSIYFGNGIYGIQSAAQKYFSVNAKELSLNQAAALCATVKSPAKYNPLKNDCNLRKNIVLKSMLEQNYITQAEYAKYAKQDIKATLNKTSGYFTLADEELYSICEFSPYSNEKISVYTAYDKKAQNALNCLGENEYATDINKSAYIISADGKIKAAFCKGGDQCRMPASTIKPLLVYAPAIENGIISSATLINDQKTNFGDYCPSNYGNKYYGWISAKQCLSKSLNVPAVKILDGVGVKKAAEYIKKTGIEISELNLNCALGVFDNGISLKTLCGAYTVFLNGGDYYSPHCILKVMCGNKTLYTAKNATAKVFCAGTCDVINDALAECAKSGTAKALNGLPYNICAKTGTNGTEKGNTDAYTVCYTGEDIFAVRFSAPSGKLMQNNITGGTVAVTANNIVKAYYANRSPQNIKKSDESITVRLCKLAYADQKIMKAPPEQPDRYVISELFLKKYLPQETSSYYTCPTLFNASIEKKLDGIKITVNKLPHIGYEIIKADERGSSKIADTAENTFCEQNLPDGIYTYTLIPYIETSYKGRIYGEQFILPQIIIDEKNEIINKDWWRD